MCQIGGGFAAIAPLIAPPDSMRTSSKLTPVVDVVKGATCTSDANASQSVGCSL